MATRFTELEQRVRHLEELLRDALDRQRLQDERIGAMQQNQNLQRPLPGAGGSRVISAVATGTITAASGDTPGTGTANLRHRVGSTFSTGRSVTVKSNFTTAVASGKRLEVYLEDEVYKLLSADCPD